MAVANHESEEDAFEHKCEKCGTCYNKDECPKCNGNMEAVECQFILGKRGDSV